MVTEDFCFPTIANNLAHLNTMSSPSLWRIPSESEKIAGARHKWCRKSFSELEGKSRRQDMHDETEVGGGGAEEKMDMLWEDLNEELHGNHETGNDSSGSDCRRPPDVARSSDSIPKRAGEQGVVKMCKTSSGGPFSPLLVVKMLKKLLILQNSATLKRNASLP